MTYSRQLQNTTVCADIVTAVLAPQTVRESLRSSELLAALWYTHPSTTTGAGFFAKAEKAITMANTPEGAAEARRALDAFKVVLAGAQAEKAAEKAAKLARAEERKAKAANVTENGVQLRKVDRKAFETLNGLMAQVRTQYAERAAVIAQETVDGCAKKLAAAGSIGEAFPMGRGGDAYARVRQLVGYPYEKHTELQPKRIEAYVNDAKRAAQAEVDSYVIKLAEKINKPVLGLTVRGDLWHGSTLTVTTPEGEETWVTQCIINCSCLGKLFNQWPTRKV